MQPDDEAFIRTILANPGDDAPRLVYADWLEERGDERGNYLRHEALWARTKETGVEKRLRTMAKGIEPVWLARVSRPPVGVCCDHVRFVSRPNVNTDSEINGFESQLEINLPAAYRAFMLNYNGGRPVSLSSKQRSKRTATCRQVSIFHSIAVSKQRGKPSGLMHVVETYWFHYRELTDNLDYSDKWLRSYLPIASPASEYGRDVFVGLSKRVAGRIFAFDYTGDFEPKAMIRIAPSLAEFLLALTFDH